VRDSAPSDFVAGDIDLKLTLVQVRRFLCLVHTGGDVDKLLGD
jgi:hypothetical protein